jgi:hypothetical protein
MEKTKVLMCSRVGDIRPVYGSLVGRCEKCKVHVWIAPSGVDMMRAGDMMIYCLACGAKSVEETKGDVMPPTERQMSELETDRDMLDGN